MLKKQFGYSFAIIIDRPCTTNEFKCDDDVCISNLDVCDSVDDCSNGEDEWICVQTRMYAAV